ncbi:hypothetical protein JHK82_026864 [Glycine max]|nr:hypothetical protein JHK85_027488 [Glycine max]KAG5126029.1 hypothetical protein JHK82_026864 [Glycine max]
MQDGNPWPGKNMDDHPGMIQVRVSAVLSNAPFALNLDCDQYINNSKVLREAMCFLMDPQIGKKFCYVQFPRRFDGIDCNDRYANHNTVFFDINMKCLDGIQGPMHVGTGCVFNRQALYGCEPPFDKRPKMESCSWPSCSSCCSGDSPQSSSDDDETDQELEDFDEDEEEELSFISSALMEDELRWSGVSIQDWWRNEQFWVTGGVSAHLFAVFQGLLKVGGVHTNFTVRAKSANDTAAFGQLYLFKWTTLLIPPTSLVILNMVGIVAGISDAINNGYDSWGPFFGKLFFSLWVILHLYPFLKGLMGRQNRTPYHCSPLVNSSSHNFLNDLGAN